eukprot:3030107-Rhodomonas_salina.1
MLCSPRQSSTLEELCGASAFDAGTLRKAGTVRARRAPAEARGDDEGQGSKVFLGGGPAASVLRVQGTVGSHTVREWHGLAGKKAKGKETGYRPINGADEISALQPGCSVRSAPDISK